MNQILDGIDSVVTAISGVLYMPWVPLLLLAAGLFFTFRSKFIQIRLLGESFRVVSEKPKTKGSISSFGALMISTASRVGTGNIVGVSTAICLGGYGAVFWMWVTAILGGAHRLTKVTGTLVPIMGVLYVVIALVVVLMHLNLVPTVFQNIFASAFDFPAIFGGFAGSCMMEGIKRGLYSNEAGMGSAPNAAATADVSHPVKQGLVQMLSVFIDTILICSATALMCLCSGVEPTAEAAGAPYVQAALQNALGDFGPVFIAISMALFAFTTLIGNYYYCEGCLRFIFKKTPSQTFMTVFRIIAAVIVLLGAVISMQLAWDTADLFQALMVVINIPVILILGRTAIKALKDYTEQRKAGKNPEFKAANIGLKEKTDYWN